MGITHLLNTNNEVFIGLVAERFKNNHCQSNDQQNQFTNVTFSSFVILRISKTEKIHSKMQTHNQTSA